jgi:hypothetical protein
MIPVIEGKREAPSCATARTKTRDVAWMSGGKSLELNETP